MTRKDLLSLEYARHYLVLPPEREVAVTLPTCVRSRAIPYSVTTRRDDKRKSLE
jgi:hypothetical protein